MFSQRPHRQLDRRLLPPVRETRCTTVRADTLPQGLVGSLPLCLLGSLAAAACLASQPALATEAAACPAPSHAVFACSTGTKRVVVCASSDLSASAGGLQYRFGQRERAELIFPADVAAWRAVTRASTLSFSGGGGAVLAFDKPPYRYAVYTAIGRGWGSRAGVLVTKNGRKFASLTCRGHVDSDLGPEFFKRAGIEAGANDFELDRKSTRLNSSHLRLSRMPSSA